MGCNYSQSLHSQTFISPQIQTFHTNNYPSQNQNQNNFHRRFIQQNFAQNFKILKEKNNQYIRDHKLLEKILQNHFFFYKLSSFQRQNIIKKMILCTAEAQTYLFKQGDPANSFFIIVQGSLRVQINKKTQKILKRGDYFGQLALINKAPRSASIYIQQKSKFWCLNKILFKKTIQDVVRNSYKIAKKYLSKIGIFTFLTQQQKSSIAYAMVVLKYQSKQIIFKQLDDANSFFIIIKGNVEIQIREKTNILLSVGQSFGQQSFLQNQLRGGTAIAKGQTVCLSISRQNIKNILGSRIRQIILYNMTKWIIKRCKLLKKLSNIEIERILENRKYINYRDEQVIHYGMDDENVIIICLQGSVNNINSPCLIGQQLFLDQEHPNLKNKIDYIKNGDGIITIIKQQQIKNLINNSQNKKNKLPIRQSSSNLFHFDFSFLKDIKIQKLLNITNLGQGQFGKVYLVKHSHQNDQLYAIKCILKQKIIYHKLEKIVIQEKKILSKVNFPYIVKFLKSFKDSFYIYFLTQYIKGIQLTQIIHDKGIINPQIIKFYLATIILCIQYLHSKKIIYRDLKPQNIMINTQGHLKLIDMGTAKQLKKITGFRTFTVIGTPHYMAPQIMQGRGYSFSVDIWSIGILFYQFMCGKLPFGQSLNDPYQIHSEIIKNDVNFPQYIKDSKIKKLINQMLNKLPQLRLPKGFDSLKAESYFDGFQWQLLQNYKLKPPYIPDSAQIPINLIKNSKLFINNIIQNTKLNDGRNSILCNWDAEF